MRQGLCERLSEGFGGSLLSGGKNKGARWEREG